MMFDRRTLLGTLAAIPFLAAASPATSRRTDSDLQTRSVGEAGRDVPVIGVGTARRFQGASSDAQLAPLREAVSRFAALGGRLIDTAPSYGNAEEVVGRLVAELGIRDRLFLATKVGAGNPEEGRAQIAQSFRNLRTDVIDLIAVHNMRDAANQFAILRELKDAGRIRSLGVTVSSRGGFAQTAGDAAAPAEEYAAFETLMRRERMDVIQIDYALDNRGADQRILPLAQEQGLAVMINLPFGRGRLFQATQGRPLPGWASEIGATTWAQIFLKYIVSHPARPIAIPGMAQARYVEDNLGAARGPMPDAAMRRRMEQFVDAL